jgi:glycerate 2-kinase
MWGSFTRNPNELNCIHFSENECTIFESIFIIFCFLKRGPLFTSTHFPDDLTPANRETIEAILKAGLAAVDPGLAVQQSVRRMGTSEFEVGGQNYSLDSYRRVLLIGFGKAAIPMAAALESILAERLTSGLVISKHVDENSGLESLSKIQVKQGSHPVPDQQSIQATQALMEITRDCTKEDLIFCLISGGGSALFTHPVEGITLEDMQALTRQLLKSGAEIGEINTLRKHLDRVKGGGLARWLFPAQVVTLIISDVIGSPLEVIASGPTVADLSTFADAVQILRKYHLNDEIPGSITDYFRRGLTDESLESVKPGDPALERVQNLVIASNYQAARACSAEGQRQGMNTLILTTYLHGEASQTGLMLASILKQLEQTGEPLYRPACVIAGGETTVTVQGNGLGGRNLEVALGSIPDLAGIHEIALVTLGTDGEDGPTDAAGAVVTGETLKKAVRLHLNPGNFLANNDSYHFFEQTGGLILTGPTGTNVNDLALLFAF